MSIRVSRLLIAAAISLSPLYASTAHAACTALTDGVVQLTRFDVAGAHTVFTQASGAAPEGILAYDTTNDLLKVCDGSAWQNAATGGGGTPGGTDTQIQFNNAGAFDGSSNLVWNNTNSRMGIGGASLAGNYGLAINGSTGIVLQTGTTAKVTLEVGRLWTSAGSFHIASGPGGAYGNSALEMSDWNANLSSYVAALTTEKSLVFSIDSNNDQTTNGVYFTANALSSAYNPASSPNLLTILETGNVGIGITTPNTVLSIGVPAATQTQAGGQIAAGRTNAADTFEWGVRTTGDGVDDGRSAIQFRTTVGTGGSDSALGFITNKYGTARAERMTIDKDGNVGIGTTSPSFKFVALGHKLINWIPKRREQ